MAHTKFLCYCLSVTALQMLCIHTSFQAWILDTLNAMISPKLNDILLLATVTLRLRH